MKSRIVFTAVSILTLSFGSAFGQVMTTSTPQNTCGDAIGYITATCDCTVTGWEEGTLSPGPNQVFTSITKTTGSSFTYSYNIKAPGKRAFIMHYYLSNDPNRADNPTYPFEITANESPRVGTLSASNVAGLESLSGQFSLTNPFGSSVAILKRDSHGTNYYANVPPNTNSVNFTATQTATYYARATNGTCAETVLSNEVTVEIYKQGVLSGPASVAEGARVELSLTEIYKSIVRWEYSTDGGTTWVNFDYTSYGNGATGDAFADTHKLTKTTKFRVLVDRGPYGTAYTNTVDVAYLAYTDAFPVLVNGASYVRTQQVRVSGVTNPNDVAALPATQKQESITYLDGNGQAVQQNNRKASPLQNDIISVVSHTTTGAQTTQYLPYVSTANDGAYRANGFTEQATFYTNGTSDKIADSAYPFAQATFERSPLGRPLEQGSVGQEFQLGGGHTTKMEYFNNDAGDQVRLFKPDGTSTTFYAANDLIKTQVTDGDQKKNQVFADKFGRTIMTRVQLDETIWLETYYIYNESGAVKYMVSPKGVKALKDATWVLSAAILNQYVHQFVYNVRGMLIEKKVPGQAWMYYCYDRLDRLVLAQDGNTGANKWIFLKYDRRGRPVMQGLYTNTAYTTRAQLQLTVLDPLYALDTDLYYEERGAAAHGYTNQSFPTTNTDVHNVNYYDTYDFDNNGIDDKAYIPQGLAGENTPATTVWGMPTGSKRLVLGTTGTTAKWLYAYSFYDADGRVIQTQSNNHLSATVDNITTAVYDFEGKALLTKNYHSAGTGKQTTVVNKFIYDAGGRLQQVKQNNNNAPTDQLLAYYEYNELGQLVDKKLHGTGSTFLQSIDFRYNIQGKLTSINNAQLNSGNGVTTNDDPDSNQGDYFGIELLYQNTETGLNSGVNEAAYNGNISAMKWKGAGAASGATGQRSYKFAYDKSNRLKDALSQRNDGSAWTKEAGAQNESMAYDYNGNIQGLTRNQRKHRLDIINGVPVASYTSETIDNLAYSYDPAMGDQLLKVTDAASGTAEAGFNNGTSGTANDYSYDANGNLTADLNKGISSILYNHLGKPVTITFADGRHQDYVYDATGAKLTLSAYDTKNALKTTTDYVNGFVYENNTLSFFSSPEGRVVNTNGTLEYQYAIADHQGNTRIVFSSQAPAPFAPLATFEGDSNDNSSQYLNATTNVVPSAAANHTPGGSSSKVVKMNQSYKLGPAQNLAVFPGDKVDIEVWEYHEGSSGFGTTSTPLANLITTVAATIGGVSGAPGEAGLKYSGVNSALTNFGVGGNVGDARPAAYLNYILFDKNYKVLDAGWKPAPATTFTQQAISFNTIEIKEPGYIYVYLSYDDDSNNWVYFDDFKVKHTKTNIIQYNEYYPFGLQASTSWTRENSSNNFLYNEGSEVNTTTGWYDLPYRNYDASVGRFMQVDPLATKYASMSSYHYSGNNPVMMNDPSGAEYYPNYYYGGDPNGPNGRNGPPLEHESMEAWRERTRPKSGSTLDRLWDETVNGVYKWYDEVRAKEELIFAASNGDADALAAYAQKYGRRANASEVADFLRLIASAKSNEEHQQEGGPFDEQLRDFIKKNFQEELNSLSKTGKVVFWVDGIRKYIPWKAGPVPGQTFPAENNKKAFIVLTLLAFKSQNDLYVTLAHEFVHARDILNGNYEAWTGFYGSTDANSIMENHAYQRSAELERKFGLPLNSERGLQANPLPESFMEVFHGF